MYKVTEVFEYLVNDNTSFLSAHDILDWVAGMTCPLWDGYQDMLPKNSEGGFTFINPDGYYHFGGPDQMDGYVIRELEGWLKEYKEISEGDSHLMLNWLNELDVVFYEIEGEIKCFVLKELD